MNKSELIEHIARQADISKAAASRALEAMIGGVKTSLKKNNAVSLVGFGTFSVGKRAARKALDNFARVAELPRRRERPGTGYTGQQEDLSRKSRRRPARRGHGRA